MKGLIFFQTLEILPIEQLHKKSTRIGIKEGDVFVCALLRFRKPDGRDAYVKFAKDFSGIIKEFGSAFD